MCRFRRGCPKSRLRKSNRTFVPQLWLRPCSAQAEGIACLHTSRLAPGSVLAWCRTAVRFKGAKGNAITLSSSPLSTVCTHCGAKLRPVLEEFASGPAIAKRFAQAPKEQNRESAESCEEVFRAASNGDKAATDILTSAGEALGVSVAFLVNVLDPEMVVVGRRVGYGGRLVLGRIPTKLPRTHLRR